MKFFKSSINNKSASFKSNKKAMNELLYELNSYLKLSKIQGSEFALKKAQQRMFIVNLRNMKKLKI